MLSKIKNNIFLLLSSIIIIYFLINLIGGERGLISYFEKKETLINLKKDELILQDKIKNLDLKNYLLTNNLNLDFIETLIRDKFLIGKSNEKIYIIKNEN